MKLDEYKRQITSKLRQATLCFLIKNDEILLAMKKRGFGQGKWNGVGGKQNDEEEIGLTAVRETREEIGVTPKNLEKVALLNFYFPHNSNWNQQVVVYLAKDWDGEPTESDEMAPKWYKKSQLPFDSMWQDDIHWLPLILSGQKIEADFMFGEKDSMLEFYINEIS